MDRRIRKTKNNIRDAFISLLMEKDYSKITVTEITERADISRRTFYMHYNSLDDILNEIQHELSDKVHAVLDGKDFTNTTLSDIKEIFQEINHILNKNYAFYKRIASIHSYSFFINMLKTAIRDILITTLSRTFSLESPIVYAYAEYFSAGIISLYVGWLQNDSGVSLDILVDVAAQITYNGISGLIIK